MEEFMRYEQENAEQLATKLGVHIPHHISIHFWVLPLLVAIVDRIEQLEKDHREHKHERKDED